MLDCGDVNASNWTVGTISVDYPTAGCARVRIGDPADKQTLLDEKTIVSLERVLTKIEAQISLQCVVFTGCAPGRFIAGADLKTFESYKTVDEARAAARRGQKLFHRISLLPWPTVAAIDGPCLGGGLELALACRYRVATDSSRTRLGLPEVLLGIIPGFGGSQRLPRLIGFQDSLHWVLACKRYNATEAQRAGVIDWVSSPADLDQTAVDIAEGKLQIARNHKKPLLHRFLDSNRLTRSIIASTALKRVVGDSRGRYPAPGRAIEIMRDGLKLSIERGLEREADACAELLISKQSRELVRIFILSENAKKAADRAAADLIVQAAVVGAGAMGGGIAMLLAERGVVTQLYDSKPEAIANAMKRAIEYFGKKSGRGRMTPAAAREALLRIQNAAEMKDIAKAQFVVEAISEDLNDKAACFRALETIITETAVLASNTSALSISKIQESLSKPGRAVGMHFFNPVDRMPLVEIIAGKKTSPAAVAVAAGLALRLGKTPIVVADSPGFLINRLLGCYITEAARLLAAGLSIVEIDGAAREAGMPMGPFQLLDEVGIDVAVRAGASLAEAFGDRFRAGDSLQLCVDAGRLGRKSAGGGFYKKPDPQSGDGRIEVARDIGKIIGVAWAASARGPNSKELARDAGDRLMLSIAVEARRAVESGVIASPDLLDLACVLGMGYPAWRGGPLRDLQNRGGAGAELIQNFGARYGGVFRLS